MVEFESGEKLNSTSLCYNSIGKLVYANEIMIGEEAYTAATQSSLGRRSK